MKKKFLICCCCMISGMIAMAQNSNASYPIPDYSNEVCLLKKDSTLSLQRLEKGSSKQEMKTKMMGMAGMDQGYELDGESSPVRLTNSNNLVFVFYTGEAKSSSSSPVSDSMMRANGIDPAAMQNPMASMMDPTKSISLYNMKADKGKRKILLMSMGLMGKSKKTASKYTLSVKKIKDNYYELQVDKASLPKGEYAFVMMDGNMDQSYSLFAFGVD